MRLLSIGKMKANCRIHTPHSCVRACVVQSLRVCVCTVCVYVCDNVSCLCIATVAANDDIGQLAFRLARAAAAQTCASELLAGRFMSDASAAIHKQACDCVSFSLLSFHFLALILCQHQCPLHLSRKCVQEDEWEGWSLCDTGCPHTSALQ